MRFAANNILLMRNCKNSVVWKRQISILALQVVIQIWYSSKKTIINNYRDFSSASHRSITCFRVATEQAEQADLRAIGQNAILEHGPEALRLCSRMAAGYSRNQQYQIEGSISKESTKRNTG